MCYKIEKGRRYVMKMDVYVTLYLLTNTFLLTLFYVNAKLISNFKYIFVIYIHISVHITSLINCLARLNFHVTAEWKCWGNERLISYVCIARLFDCYFIYHLSKCMCLRTRLYTNDKSKKMFYAKAISHIFSCANST